MEILVYKCWESSTHFSDGRTKYSSSYSMLQTVTSLQIYFQGMHVTHLVNSSHVTLWKRSLDLVVVPQTLLTLK